MGKVEYVAGKEELQKFSRYRHDKGDDNSTAPKIVGEESAKKRQKHHHPVPGTDVIYKNKIDV